MGDGGGQSSPGSPSTEAKHEHTREVIELKGKTVQTLFSL
jgi:hypothetical protein